MSTRTASDEAGGGRRRPARSRWRIVLAVVLLLLAVDLVRPPADQLTAGVLIGAVKAYQGTLSPWLSRAGVRCRFEPSCSHYAVAVLERDGAAVGTIRTAGRLLRCGPWTPAGTLDPP